MEAIRAESLVKEFGDVRALNQANLAIQRGELFFLLGASGCGKTTLLRCIAGLETPTSGRVIYGGRDVSKLPAHKREAAMVFQSYALWPHMDVGENVAFGLVERKVAREEIDIRVNDVLAMVQLDGCKSRRIDELSGGQQQRVALARALIVKPRCLLLDEPLSNLDAKLRFEMRREIRRIVKENNLTAIYVTHDQEEALSIADRMAIMDAGRVLQVGSPDEIYKNPLSSHVASFIGDSNLVEATVDHVELGDELAVRVSCESGEFHGRITRKNWRPAQGMKVLISIRPEALYSLNSGVPVNRVEGHILDRMYLGSSIQYRVRTASGQLWSVTETNPYEVWADGDYVFLTVETRDVNILKV